MVGEYDAQGALFHSSSAAELSGSRYPPTPFPPHLGRRPRSPKVPAFDNTAPKLRSADNSLRYPPQSGYRGAQFAGTSVKVSQTPQVRGSGPGLPSPAPLSHDDLSRRYKHIDGNRRPSPLSEGGTAPIATAGVEEMAATPPEHPLPSRPPIYSHQSNSVPSTPHQHATDFRTRSRSPSPHGGLGNHSPRSVVSEANAGMTALPKGRPTCKYETSAAFSRRRMQYNIGDAPLEKPKDEPKKALDPHEEKKLSGDMRELYDRLLPSKESESRRAKLVDKLGVILRKEWPQHEFKVHVFGSSGNLLSTSESDVDICIQTPMKKLESMHMLAEVLANNGMERVVCVAAAKVPIVKLWDPELKLAADLNVNNTLALENTRMIKTYVMVDDRVRPLAMIIKHWTKQRVLNDAGIGGTLSSYAWICLILNFLQTRTPPILPALHQMPHENYIANDGTESGFSDDLNAVKGFGKRNTETIGDLLFHFFRRYAYEIEYEQAVVSVRHGRLLSRKEKKWDHASKEGQWRLCIEEPFNTTRNLGNSADSTAFRGLHLELRRAFELLSDGGQLEKCCEQYQFPPEEKGHFKKPAHGPKAVLSAPNNPATRITRQGAGGNPRGTRANNGGKTTTAAYRRSSSGAAFGRMTGITGPMHYMHGQMISQTPDLFYDQYMYTSQSPELLREYVYYRNVAAAQARSVVGTFGSPIVQSTGSSRDPSTTASPQKAPYVTNSPQPENNPIVPGYVSLTRPRFGEITGLPIMQDAPKTNPSSPSISNSVPVRRGLQRASVSGGSQSSTVRSQSQPARGISNFGGFPMVPIVYDASGRPMFANLVPQELGHSPRPELPLRFGPGYSIGTVTGDSPKEYVGYYMNQSGLTHQPQYPNFSVGPIPSYTEISNRRKTQELQPLDINGQRRLSRSPSPLGHGHARTYSTPLRSAPLPMPPESAYMRPEPVLPTEYPRQPGGLLIVNGSGSAYPISNLHDNDYSQSDPVSQLGTPFEEHVSDSMHNSAILEPVTQNQQKYYGDQFEEIAAVTGSGDLEVNGPPSGDKIQDRDAVNATSDMPSQLLPPFTAPIISSSTNYPSEPENPSDTWANAQQNPWKIVGRPKAPKPSLGTVEGTMSPPKQSEHMAANSRVSPLLSPVAESGIPTPTTQHKPSTGKRSAINGIANPASSLSAKPDVKVNGDIFIGSRDKPVPPTPAASTDTTLSPKENAENEQGTNELAHDNTRATDSVQPKGNQWETKTNKKKKPKSSHKKKSGAQQQKDGPESSGQPMPANEAERKGG